MSGSPEAVIQCSEKPLIWSDVEYQFFVKTIIGTDMDFSYVTVPTTALVHPLCVIPDDGGDLTFLHNYIAKAQLEQIFWL